MTRGDASTHVYSAMYEHTRIEGRRMFQMMWKGPSKSNFKSLELRQGTKGRDKVKGCDLGTKSSLKPDLRKLVTFYTTGTSVASPCTVHSVVTSPINQGRLHVPYTSLDTL